MPNAGFWSYVHADDDAEQGRIRQLAEDLSLQYEAITGEKIDLFLDRASLGWGDDWEDKIESSIMSTVFFVPVISPRYLTSEACRRELQLFARKAEGLGVNELVLPVLWFDVPELSDSDPTDDLVVLIKRYQWDDWRDLRFEERHSAAYRRAVAALAQRLVDVNARLNSESLALTSALPAIGNEEEDDTPGTLDLLASAMTALPAWTHNIESIGAQIQAVSELAHEATAKMHEGDRRGQGFATRLTVAKEFGRSLEPHSQRLEELSNEFTTNLYDVDGGIRAIIVQAEAEANDQDSRDATRAFFDQIRGMADSSRQGLSGVKSLVDSIAPVEGVSRDMRAPLRKMRKALTVMVEGQAVIDEWVRLIDQSPIDFSDPTGTNDQL